MIKFHSSFCKIHFSLLLRGFFDPDIAQHHIPEADQPATYLRFLTFDVYRDIFLRSIFIHQAFFPVIPLETLVYRDYTYIASIGLPFKVTDILNFIPLDIDPIIIQLHEPVEVFPDLVVVYIGAAK